MKPIDADALREKFADVLNSTYTDDYAKVFVAGLYAAMNMPTLTQPNEWVSVEDRLPEKGENVLVYAIAKHIGVTKISIDKLEEGERRPVWLYTHGWFEVTHWMSLPEPPDRRPPEGEENI